MEPLPRVTPATVDVLRVFVVATSAVWGLQIVKTAGRPSGSVYPILDRLESLGWLTSEWEDNAERQGARRRYYRLTEGARELAVQAIDGFERRNHAVVKGRASPPELAGA